MTEVVVNIPDNWPQQLQLGLPWELAPLLQQLEPQDKMEVVVSKVEGKHPSYQVTSTSHTSHRYKPVGHCSLCSCCYPNVSPVACIICIEGVRVMIIINVMVICILE